MQCRLHGVLKQYNQYSMEGQDSDNRSQDLESLHRSLRFMEEICLLLKLSRPCTKTAMDYYYQLSSSSTHRFQIEIMIATSIFLSSKIFETERKIRDILNMIFTVTALHRIYQGESDRLEEQGESLSMRELIQRRGLKEAIAPSYSLNNYNEYKSLILEAEQHLLRVLGFDFAQAEKNLAEVKTLLVLIHQLRLPQLTAQTIINTYNDLPFTRLDKWIAGIFYFSYVVTKVSSRNNPTEDVVIRDQQWETLFCTTVDKLRNYAIKIADYYQKKNVRKSEQPLKEDNSEVKDRKEEVAIEEEVVEVTKKELIDVQVEQMAIEGNSID